MEAQVDESFFDLRYFDPPLGIAVEHIEGSLELENLVLGEVWSHVIVDIELFGFGWSLLALHDSLWFGSPIHKIYLIRLKIKNKLLDRHLSFLLLLDHLNWPIFYLPHMRKESQCRQVLLIRLYRGR